MSAGVLDLPSGSVAIIGMAGRFPGAETIAEFWRNQLEGVEAIRRFAMDELDRSLSERAADSGFVAARSVLQNPDLFDADFFGMYPKEAALTDPQHRLFLEVCWQAFEDAGYEPGSSPTAGVFAGCSMPTYFLSHLCPQPRFVQRFASGYQVENYPEMIGNSQDFLATRVSYKLNLRGPSFTMQAGCSTSLVAVCQACQSLLTCQCDMALAGGSSITFPQERGAHYQDGGMISPDGHCRTFDANANGTVFGSGVAVVLLKRLEEALRDGNHIYAVIRGFGVNNDGAAKAGFTAPSIEGQARAIELAHELADIDPETIGYVEAHGTGTPLGDPIELAALTRAFRKRTAKKQFCVIGTAKTNVGHLDTAAGVTGLIHAVQIVREGFFPPTLHFEKPNPALNLDESPFLVRKTAASWPKRSHPRRAGVSAFGVGGTNAHVIIEEAPATATSVSSRNHHLLVVSARSVAALNGAAERLADHLQSHSELNLADAAYTLQTGRKSFAHRRFAVATSAADAISRLRAPEGAPRTAAETPGVCFLFPGQGSQKIGMARDLYRTEPEFRNCVDDCAEILRPIFDEDIRRYLCISEQDASACGVSDESIHQTRIAQPALFVIEFALVRLLESWGIRPSAMLGHSIGEYVAAAVSGVLRLEDALRLVARRGAMMQQLPPGAMLAVRLSPEELAACLAPFAPQLEIAAANAPKQCIVSGPGEEIARLEQSLRQNKTLCTRLRTSHAFHSAMMDPIRGLFTAEVRDTVRIGEPKIPYVSNVTGDWITQELLIDPRYWSKHLRDTVQFSRGIETLQRSGLFLFLEVGPGTALSSLARQNGGSSQFAAFSCGDLEADGAISVASLLRAVGSLWTAGVQPNWDAFHRNEKRARVSLPTYPFQRERFWFEPQLSAEAFEEKSRPQEAAEVTTATSSTPVAGPIGADRSTQIADALADILAELSGITTTPEQRSVTFLELGFDSLFLTQVVIALKNKWKVNLAFRDLLGDFSSINAVAKHLDDILPAHQFASDTSQQTSAPADARAPSSDAGLPPASLAATAALPASLSIAPIALAPDTTPLERLMQQQLQAMNQLFSQQLQAMQPGNPAAPRHANLAPRLESKTPTATPPAAQPKADSIPSIENKPFGPYKPPQISSSKELGPRQKEFIAGLISRYTKRTARSKKLTQQTRLPLADPRVVAGFRPEWKEMVYPIVTAASKGAHLWDVDGNEYIDILNGFGPIFLGHRPDFIERAVEEQLHKGFEIGPQSPLAGEVAQLFCELTGNERMTFCNTGSEAVLAALRVTRTVTGRRKVVLFAGAYHGMFDEVLVKGINTAGGPYTLPIAPGIPRESVGNVVVLEYGAQTSLGWIRDNVKDLAAVLVEPVQSRRPALQPVEFLRELRRVTMDNGAALIFDEVVTGFRVHPGGCQALFNIRADLATYGKVLAGGMPIGVLAGRAEFMNALDGGMWSFGDDSYPTAGVTFFAGTFVRHPLALAAAKAMLQHLQTAGLSLQNELNQRSAEFAAKLNALFQANAVPARVENFSSIFYFHFPPDFWLGTLLYYLLRLRGIYILEGFPFFLTTAHTARDLESILSAFAESFGDLRQAGILLPRQEPAIDAGEAKSAEQSPPQTPTKEPINVPLTEEQLEIALSAQLSPQASCAYNESFTLRFHGPLNTRALMASLHDLVRRHDSLRSAITESQELLIRPAATLPITEHDFSRWSSQEAEQRLAGVVHDEAARPFDFTAAPLARAHLVRITEADHALVFTAHHIVCDGWSTNVLLSELASLYSSRVSGSEPALTATPQFADYARERRASVSDASGNESVRDFWRKQFKSVPSPLELPTDRPRPAVKSFGGATARSHIDSSLVREIRSAGGRNGCTLFAALLAGFAALLHRLTSQDDITIGIPAAGQAALPEGNLVGHCVNFLPLRFAIAESDTASSFLMQVRKRVLDACEHQNYTYGTLVRDLRIPREPGRLPLLEVQFNLEKVGSDLRFPGLEIAIDPNPKAAVNFDLFLNVVETPSGLTIDCDYNSDLFDESTIQRWLSHFETMLKGIAADSQSPIARLPFLSHSERETMLFDWNKTDRNFPRDARAQDLIREQTAKTPDAIAVICGDAQLTYRELEKRSNQLARHLVKTGVRAGDLVAVCVDRSSDMLVALLAIWKSGAAYVPLDPTHPADRLALILEDAGVSTLISESTLLELLPATDARLICIDRDEILIAHESSDSRQAEGSAESTAYVIYTSGSTGQPKGVAVTHRNLVNLLCSVLREPGLSSSDRFLAVTTISFDIAGLELFLPLIAGGVVILARREEIMDGNLLRQLIQRHRATVMQATPATWRLLLEAGWSEPLKILCGGEALPRALADQLLKCGEVWNMYGPTETTIWSSVTRVEPDKRPVPIGPPLANTRFYVLDRNLQPVPIGVRGELYIGGDGVARGYYNRPDLTSGAFIPDAFRPGDGRRIYRTGDVVRYRPDGLIDFLGRADHQVKIRGFRVELQEVERALSHEEGIRESVVLECDDDHGLKRLVAYMVLDPRRAIDRRSLRRNLQSTLPSYMIPSSFVFVDQIPRTPNGKIDRSALPSWREHSAGESALRPTASPLEAQLAAICGEVLNLSSVDTEASLFDFGADSLHLFQIAARAAKLGIPLRVEHILRFHSIASIAEELKVGQSAANPPADSSFELKPLSREAYRVSPLTI